MTGGDALPAGTQLLRVLKDRPVHVVPGRREPTPNAFLPSSADEACSPVRVSVWDAEQVTVARACEIRGGGDFAGFVLGAADVSAVAEELVNPRLRAVTDPEGTTAPEARWHYGIEGLEKAAWTDRLARNQALRRLAKACRPA